MKGRLISTHVRRIVRALLMVVGAIALLSMVGGQPATAESQPPSTASMSLEMLQAQCLDTGKARSSYHAQTGKLRFVGAEPGKPIAQPAALPGSASPEAAARGYLSVCGSLFGLRDQASELSVKRAKAADRGRTVVRFQQVYQGIPVFGGELMVNLDSAKNILSVNGEILPNISVKTAPAVNAATAQRNALQAVARRNKLSADALTATQPTLWIYNPMLIQRGGGFTSLVWRMEVTLKGLGPIRELVLVDAQRGFVALHFNQMDTAKNRETYTANNGTTLPGTLVCNESNPNCTGGDTHAASAHIYAGDTYDFYSTYHGRDSINNVGMTLKSTVHYSTGYCNAFWNGSQMVYGDGCGMPLADDVVAHELTHGVTDYESNLFYYYQSGAINESFSDLWGEFVDLTNGKGNDDPSVRWLLGEDISGLGAIRNMQNPPAFGDPDKMTSSYYYTGTGDNGGVHTNSGVNNKAVYLMTDGGTFNGQTVTGLGITKVAKIYYEVQTNLLVSGSDYADLYDALYQGCTNLIGTSGITASDCQEVRDATNAVEMNQQPVSGYNPDAPVCATGQTPSNLFFDNLESGGGNWTHAAISGTDYWHTLTSGYAHSGTYSIWGEDQEGISDTYIAMNSSVALASGSQPYLHFAHAYDFDYGGSTNYDGGVLEYSTNAGASWNDAGGLFDQIGYNGTISTAESNPLGNRSGFVNVSHGYIASRLNLSSLAGQSVRFRWRIGTGQYASGMGWLIDDVRIYTCSGTPTSYTLTTNVNPSGSGTITANPAPNCGSQYCGGTIVTLTANANSGYSFSNWSGNASGSSNPTMVTMDGNKSVTANFVAAPPNDDFNNATIITSIPYSTSQSTIGATTASDDPSFTCFVGQGYKTVWFRYTPSQSGGLTVDTFGSNYDTVLAVWTGNRGSLTSVGCNDDTGSLQSQVRIPVTQGQTYHIEVASYSNNGGQLTLNVTPFTTNWVIKSPMSVPRTRLATAAVNGKVYVIGGESWMAGLQSSGGKGDIGFRASALPSALPTGIEEYNPVTDTWANKAPKPTGVSNISAGVVNNKIYVVGGWNGSSCTSVVEAYDPATNTWATVASLPSGLCGVAAAGVNDKLYAIGGGTTSGTAVPTCSVYDPPSNSWSSCAAMTYPRFWAGAGVVNGKIYIVGGGDFAVPNSNYVEEYDPTTNTWITRAPLSTARGGLGAVGVGNYLYVCGGGTGTYLSTCERYDPAANNWSSFDTMYVGRAFLGMAVANGKLYAEGGENWNAGGFLATNEENAVTTCYSLTTSVNPGGTGSISASPAPNCGTQYTTGTVVTLTANANSGYAFSNWSGDASGSANPTGIVMDGNKSVIANFTACYTLTTSANPSGSGTVNASPAPNCGSQYVSGTVVALTANANSGYAFSSWGGDASGSSNPTTVTMDSNKSVSVNFTTCYSLTTNANPSGSGTVNASPAPNCGSQYISGTVVTLIANANSGYAFSSWGGDASGSNPTTVTMNGNKSVIANFTACYSLTTSANPSGGGSVSASPAPNCGSLYTSGAVVTLTATANAGYTFGSWGGDASGSNPTTVTMNGNKSVIANFTACYSLATSASPSGSGSVSADPAPNCGTQYTSGTVVTLTATANAGYTFSSWNGDASGSSNPTTVTMNATKSVTANFTACYSLTTSANPSGGGSVSASPAPNCGSQYTAGTVVTLTASANSGYTFGSWSGDASGSSNPVSVTMDGTKSVTARFIQQAPPVFPLYLPIILR